MASVPFSPSELQHISRIQELVKELNQELEKSDSAIGGYFTWQFMQENRVLASPDADFPDLIIFNGAEDE